MQRSRAIWLRDGISRHGARNNNTIGLPDQPPDFFHPPQAARSPLLVCFGERFVRHYDAIREVCERTDAPGVAVVAVDQHGVAASALLAARSQSITTAIIGRHNMAELFLPSDPTLSLRHLAVILHPLRPGSSDVRFRLLDLRTASAFSDEHGARLEALEAEGAVIVSCARHALYFLPTGSDLPWPDRGNDGWQCIPERIYLGDVPAEPDRWQRKELRVVDPAVLRQRARPTLVRLMPGPELARERMVAEGEEPLGELRLESSRGSGAIVVGASGLRQGILLGRAARCDSAGLGVLEGRSISRVHLLLVEVTGTIYAIDTASTHGLWVGGERTSLAPVNHGTELVLDTLGTRGQWRLLN